MIIGLNHRKKIEENLIKLKKLISEIEEINLDNKNLTKENLKMMQKLNRNLYFLEHFSHQIRSASSISIKESSSEKGEILAKIY